MPDGTPKDFAANTAAVTSSIVNERSSAPNQKPTGARTPAGRVGWPYSQRSALVTATLPVKIEMRARQTDVSLAAAAAGTMTRVVPTTMTRTAAMPHRAPAVARVAVAVVTDDSAFTIHRRAAGAAVVRDATAGMAVRIPRLTDGRSEQDKASRDSQEGNELFHEDLVFGFDSWPQLWRLIHQTRPASVYSAAQRIFLP